MTTKKTIKAKPFPFKPGDAVFIRTVTHHHTGRVLDVGRDWIKLDEGAWIADDGRFHVALRDGVFNEVEPIPSWFVVGRGAIIDIFPWGHPLPKVAK